MNPELEIAGFDDHARAGWMTLAQRSPAATLRTFANEAAPPQFLLGAQGDADPALIERILALLDHPHVVRLAGFGLDDEGVFLATELVEGMSLAQLLRASGEVALPNEVIAVIGVQVAEALAATHDYRCAKKAG